ncbi:hypothetical protein [Marinobacter sp. CHS3-4]|uniref:hypothetical protein n=1 Tax=Marinobacter sp. CHS3-4 TaxID=3045174 RepID=UPI0024B51702|nr:hypothetical protein [Marinobacter sp. CHS3-4]MDI9244642.1 hypothetical protein [Marinobacter sp. CHS3-4]
MKRTFIYSAYLSLLLAVPSSYGAQWEVQMESAARAERMAASAGNPNFDWPAIQARRRVHFEHTMGGDSDLDIAKLPPTAAGPRDYRGMRMYWRNVEKNRRMQLERGM